MRGALEHYASRGGFRSYSELGTRRGLTEFKFLWLLPEPCVLQFDTKKGTFRFKDFLPNIPAKDPMYKELKAFLKERTSEEVLEHRRVDPERAAIKASNRLGSVSISLEVLDSDFKYGIKKAVNLAHEIYMDFVKSGPYYEYMLENLGLSVDEE